MLESAVYQRYGQPNRRKRSATTDDLYEDEKVSSSFSEDEYMDEKDEEDDSDNENSANEKNINKDFLLETLSVKELKINFKGLNSAEPPG